MEPRKPTQEELEDIFAPKEEGILKMREIDEPLEWFKEQMKLKLRENDHKGGWDDCSVEWLLERLVEEAIELQNAIFNNEPLENRIKESADVANYSMMIADVTRKKMDKDNGY